MVTLEQRKRREDELEKARAKQKQIELIRNEETGRVSGVKLPDGRTILGSEKEITQLAKLRGEKSVLPTVEATEAAAIRRAKEPTELTPRQVQFQQEAGVLKEQLGEKILNQPSLKPEPLTETLGGIVTQAGEQLGVAPGQTVDPNFLLKAATGKLNQEDIRRQGEGALRRLITGGTLAGSSFAIPAVARSATAASIGQRVFKLNSTVKAAGLVILGSFVGGQGLSGITTDINRDDLDVIRGQIEKISGESSTIQSAVQNEGLTPEEGLLRLQQLSNTIDEAEETVKQLANYNLKYRNSDEYLIMQEIMADARSNVVERVGGVQNLGLTGRTTTDPEELVMLLAQGENPGKARELEIK